MIIGCHPLLQKLPSMKLPPGGLPAMPPLPPLQNANPLEPLQNPLSIFLFAQMALPGCCCCEEAGRLPPKYLLDVAG